MSFTTDVKHELCAMQYEQRCCMRAHLAGLAGFCGALTLKEGQEVFRMRTESAAIARRVYTLLKEICGVKAVLETTGKICAITIDETPKNVLAQLGFCEKGVVRFSVNPFIVHDDCCKTAFLAGAFLGGGYVKTPKNGYHFEIKTHYHTLSKELCDMICDMGFDAKWVTRKSDYVIYLKQSDAISDILVQMGATEAMFELVNEKILKDMRNNIIRKVNCDTANIQKAAEAAALQLRAIDVIKTKRGLESLPDNLYQIAELRLENPEANLTELGQMLTPPISKSGVNQRLKKIIRLAEDLTQE